jgi:uncharacterized protein YndB with AHSA1/START domain
MVPERVEREIHIEAAPDVVWSVLTEADHVAAWFSDSAEIDLRPGGEAVFTWNQHGPAHARIEQVDPPRLLSYRWMRAVREHPPAAELDETNSTLVELTLHPEDEGTRLQVVESGFQQLAGGEDEIATYAEENREGWGSEFGELRDYILRELGGTASR